MRGVTSLTLRVSLCCEPFLKSTARTLKALALPDRKLHQRHRRSGRGAAASPCCANSYELVASVVTHSSDCKKIVTKVHLQGRKRACTGRNSTVLSVATNKVPSAPCTQTGKTKEYTPVPKTVSRQPIQRTLLMGRNSSNLQAVPYTALTEF